MLGAKIDEETATTMEFQLFRLARGLEQTSFGGADKMVNADLLSRKFDLI